MARFSAHFSSPQKILRLFLKALMWFVITSVAWTLFYRFVPVAYTPLMFWRSTWAFLQGNKPVGMAKKWVPLEHISKPLRQAVIKAEDHKFYQHHGFDFEAIEKAVEYNKKHKKKKGASTISQQTAKNVFLWPTRSWFRKGLEAYFTVLIELLWSKERILEVYLNVIEQGEGVYGVEASAQKFFKKPAQKIRASEAALMAAVLPNPLRFRIDRPGPYILRRQRRIMGVRSSPPKQVEDKSKDFFALKFGSDEETEVKEEEVKKEEALQGAESARPEEKKEGSDLPSQSDSVETDEDNQND